MPSFGTFRKNTPNKTQQGQGNTNHGLPAKVNATYSFTMQMFLCSPTFVRKVHQERTKKCEINAKGKEGKQNCKKKAKVMM